MHQIHDFKAILRAEFDSQNDYKKQANHDVRKINGKSSPANSTSEKPSNICYNFHTQVKASFHVFLTLSGRMFILEAPRVLEIQNCTGNPELFFPLESVMY